ncbi:ABC transporter permease [Marivirga sp. S37H4]|uniref:ABC transporter permease n=1 Tax=Marivirga aurantiaca TaxID=2802615 RepID=A0A934WWQ3_9BACT|nr:ABC transporter permease [Marivirga aurantiaca]MBK6264394.1 ABC transporter permease [Marivirga aurantiaca]
MEKEKNKVPKWALRFFRWYCQPDFVEDLEGDLLERFERRSQENNLRSARWSFTKDVVKLFRPGIIRPLFKSNTLNQNTMFITNFKLGIRSLYKRKAFAFINSFGLSIGIASALLIFLYVQTQFSYDKSYSDHERIYKMVQKVNSENGSETYATVPYSLVNIIIDSYPEIETGTAVSGPYDSQVVTVRNEANEDVQFIENSVLLADSNFFSIFSLDFLNGDPKTALSNPHSVVLTERTAKQFFGDTNPVGKFIAPSGKNSIVTGVCKNPPANSHLQFNYIVSSSSVGWFSQDQFNLRSANCYFKLKPSADAGSLELKFPKLVENYVLKEIERARNISREEYKKAGNSIAYLLKPLTSLHLSEENLGGFQPGGNIVTVRILIVVGLLILIIACINFMNLATAKSTDRAKEVGVRKVMGSFRRELIAQFLTESFIISFISVVLGVCFMWLALPYFNELTNVQLEFFLNFNTVVALFCLVIVISILSGIYPAFFLSSFSPIKALKGVIKPNANGRSVMNGLVLFQFWIATILIVSTVIINKQVHYMNEKNLGFEKEQVMVLEGISHMETHLYHPFLNEVKNLPQIQEAAGSLSVQGFQGSWRDNYRINGTQEDFNINRMMIGDNYSEVMNFELKQGQLFSESMNDSTNVILNESAVAAFGLTDPIGQQIVQRDADNGSIHEKVFTIKGVIKDFNYNSLHEAIAPLVIQSNEINYGRMRYIAIKLKEGSNLKTIEQIESKWKETLPNRPFNFRFLDDTLDAKYKSEKQAATLLKIFSALTILIACLGIFALSFYTISIRTKEIGVRKVLGAKATNIILLLSKDFVKLSFLSFIFAAPVAWYIGTSWLNNFAYRIEIDFTIFIFSALFIVMIISLTVGLQTIQAALGNPINSLKNE